MPFVRFSILRTELPDRYEKGTTLAGVIYIHRISDHGLTGIAGQNFKMFCDLCGDMAMKNVVLVTNMWGNVSPEDGEARENELSRKFSKPVFDKGARMFRHNTVQSTHDIIRKIVKNHPEVLQIQRELVDEHKDIIDTTAGAAVNRELSEEIRRHRARLKELREEMGRALKENDEETRLELAEQVKQLEDLMEKAEKDREETSSRYAEDKKRAEAAIAKVEEVKEERERAKARRDRVERGATAGAATNRELSEQIKQQQAELKELREGMGQALREMSSRYAKEKERMEARMSEMGQKAKKERERAEAEHKRQLADLGRRLRDADDVGGRNWKDDSVPVPGSKTVLPVHDHGGSAPNLAAHQQNNRLAQVVLGVYFGRPIMVRNGPLWYWVTVAILWNAGLLVCCGAGAGVYLFLLQRSLSCEVAGLT